MASLLIKGGTIINEGAIRKADILVVNDLIHSIGDVATHPPADKVLDATGLLVLPGIIDDQVHFREPGLITKGTIATESKAALAGGITSFMEMPNTIPPTTTLDRLQEKVNIAYADAWCNFSFYLGATNDNIGEVRRIDPETVCGVKAFMGSSTGDLLVDDPGALTALFDQSPVPVAVHSEDEATIRDNIQKYKKIWGDNAPPEIHPLVRSREACVICTERALQYGRETGGHLHLLHISTADEVRLIREAKRQGLKVTAEVCVHHLWFSDADYPEKGNFIKWNPSIKTETDRLALIEGLGDGTIDMVATDHAPHELGKKMAPYFAAPSGGPMVEHSLAVMLEMAAQGRFTKEDVAKWMAHAPADVFRIDRRGYVREGYFADLVLVRENDPYRVSGNNTHYLVKWSPLEGELLSSRVTATIVNGQVAYHDGIFYPGRRRVAPLRFNR